jgi:FAD/FMN-containing dehydrogenase
MQQLADRGGYVNFMADDRSRPIAEITREVYGEEKYRRLQRLKQVHDPGNLLRGNHNVSPEP